MANDNNATVSTERYIPTTPAYRTKIKRMVEQAKSLTGLSRIPKGYPKTLKANASEKEREEFHKAKNSFFTIQTLHYLAESSKRVFEEKKAPTVSVEVAAEPIKI
jgi:hypothetical protein